MQNPRLLDEGTTERPDYQRCIAISTRAALKYMVPPGALVMLAPLITGTFFGVMAVAGLLTGKQSFESMKSIKSIKSIKPTNCCLACFSSCVTCVVCVRCVICNVYVLCAKPTHCLWVLSV